MRVSTIFAAVLLSAGVALLPQQAAVADPPATPLNFCADFNKIITNPLLESLGDDVANFIGLFDPEKADINGDFIIDDSGESLAITVFGNGMLDASNEFGLIQQIVNNPNLYTGPGNPLVVSHDDVHQAFKNNREMLRNEYFGPSLAILIEPLLGGITNVLTAYITLGDGSFLVESSPTAENPDAPIVVSGNGSFGFAGAFLAVVDFFVADFLGSGFANNTLDINDFTTFPELRPDGDVDGDGQRNVCEYRGFPVTKCAGNTGTHYIVAALNPEITPVGCFETISECVTALDSLQAVPPLVDNDTVGSVKFEVWENDVTFEQRYVLSGFHTSTNQLNGFALYAGAEGETGVRIATFGSGALPITAELTEEQFRLLQVQPTYFALRTRDADNLETAPIIEEIRGAVTCELPAYEGGETFACQTPMSADEVVPSFINARSGSLNLHYDQSLNLVFGAIYNDIFAEVNAFIGEGALGVDGTLLVDLGTIGSNGVTTFEFTPNQDTITALFSGNAFVQINSTTFPEGHVRGQIECVELPGGEGEGTPEGQIEGTPEGQIEGDPEGQIEGTPEGQIEGTPEGQIEGDPEGQIEGTPEGQIEGDPEGQIEGTPEGQIEGDPEGQIEGTPEGQVEGNPDGEEPFEIFSHSADQNNDGRVNLSELLRVIQFFNTGGLHCAVPAESTEDGFVPGENATQQDCTPHASDYNTQDWSIRLTELLRLIQFFNVGGYYACPDAIPATEDGFCLGTPPAN